ncbi:MAG: electron transfer flavoprotein subunit alpha/FixB family protein [Candidatus Hodgkinia cicadicola]
MSIKFNKVLVIPELDNGKLTNDGRLLLWFAAKTSTEVDLLAINCDLASALTFGVSKVYALASRSPVTVKAACAGVAMLLSGLGVRYDAIFVGGATTYHDALCRASAVLNKVVITNVFEIADDGVFVRSIAGGRLVQRVRANCGRPCLVSINASLVKIEPVKTNGETKTIQLLEFDSVSKSKFNVVSCIKSVKPGYLGCPPLSEAKIVFAGGSSFRTSLLFNRCLVALARKFNAGVGATRSAVEAGIAPTACQIGQTGATITPQIYVAFGISGASQHMVGVRGSKLIVAVNRDRNAPIVKQADIVLVADMFDVIIKILGILEGEDCG